MRMNEVRAANAQEFRILSIDGGGIKGVFPAAFLAELEKSLSEPIYRYFDLIAGTSTGAIVALGLGMGLKAAEITQFYKIYQGKDSLNPFLKNRLQLLLIPDKKCFH